jgi:hypothetical protein
MFIGIFFALIIVACGLALVILGVRDFINAWRHHQQSFTERHPPSRSGKFPG